MVAQPAGVASLARRIHSPRPVALATLHRREQEAYRHCERLQDALALLDPAGDAWDEVYRILLDAYALHSVAVARHQAAWEERKAAEYEAADAAENDVSLARGFRLLSSYRAGDARIWIITERDRSATTLLLPEEY